MNQAPVVYSFYRRPLVTKEVLIALQSYKPKKLYLFSDGPQNESHSSDVMKNRDQVKAMIDWDCEVIEHFLDYNVGVWAIYQYVLEFVFQFEDRLIYLEEDILPGNGFFEFCNTLLERYKDDDKIYMISGMNGNDVYPQNVNFDYFYVESTTAWGHALWKRTYEKFQINKEFMKDKYNSHLILNYLRFRGQDGWFKNLVYNSQNPDNWMDHGMEFYLMGLNQNLLHGSLAIVPVKNLVLNIGDTFGAEHSDDPILLPVKMRKRTLNIHNLSKELRSSFFIIPDYYYGHINSKAPRKLESFLLKIERALRILIFGGPKYFFFKSKKRIRVLKYEQEKLVLYKKEIENINSSLGLDNNI
jgi:hypothetical protein